MRARLLKFNNGSEHAGSLSDFSKRPRFLELTKMGAVSKLQSKLIASNLYFQPIFCTATMINHKFMQPPACKH